MHMRMESIALRSMLLPSSSDDRLLNLKPEIENIVGLKEILGLSKSMGLWTL